MLNIKNNTDFFSIRISAGRHRLLGISQKKRYHIMYHLNNYALIAVSNQ